MPRRKQELAPDPTWEVFRQRHRGNPFLQEDPLYSLTEGVIAAIAEEIPGFFTAEQQGFEEDLARRTGGGFFLRRPIGVPTSVLYQPGLTIEDFIHRAPVPALRAEEVMRQLAPALKPEWFKDGQTQEILHALRDLIVQLWEAGGRAGPDIESARRQGCAEEQLLARRGEAYVGWLLLNEAFGSELRELRAAWAPAVARQGGFPRERRGRGGAAAAPRPPGSACAKACFAFYRRWCLDRLLTWDLPAPLDPSLHHGVDEGRPLSGEEGLTLTVPWYLVRGGQFNLHEVARRIRFESAPGHLRDWVWKSSGRDEPGGEISYQRLYGLYRCYELVLFRRYRAACADNIERLDRALGRVMGREADLVKRLRQRLARGRKAAGA